MQRYSLIETNLQREMLLLQGQGCRWRGCTFCDYHSDVSTDPFSINSEALNRVRGRYGVLDIINSGSAMELDKQSLARIAEVVRERKIHTLWFEAHYLYRHRLETFAQQFQPTEVKFRCGIESFNGVLRKQWNKGIQESVTVRDVARYFRGVCLLCCVEGQTKEQILRDIALAEEYFEYYSVNLFCNNSTPLRRDERLANWFENEVYPMLKDNSKVEVLLNISDLGVG